jgi:hypothetical protein
MNGRTFDGGLTLKRYCHRMQGPVTAGDSTLVRVGMILTATGVVSAAIVRFAIDGANGDAIFAYGFLLYLGLIAIATPRAQPRFAPAIAFVAFATIYLTGTADGNDIGLLLYIGAGLLAYMASPLRLRTFTVAAFALWTPALQIFGPDPFAGHYPLSVAIAAVLSLCLVVLVVVARTAIDAEEQLRRVSLGLLAVACVACISERHTVVASLTILAPDDLWSLVVVAVFSLLMIAPIRRAVRDALATGTALAAYLLAGIALIAGKPYHDDAVAVAHRAAELLLAGGDPYRDLNVTEALGRFGLDPQLATHLIDGSPVHAFNYPALSFLVPAPFLAAGLQDVRYLYLAEILVFVLVLIRVARVPWRPLVAAAVVGNAIIARQNVLAGIDPLWAILVAFAFLFVGRRWSSPICMGLAVAARQPAWFFAPFYVLVEWKRFGPRAALRAATIAAAVAVAPNLPFFVASPGAFLGGVSAPMIEPLEPYGVGLIRFATDGLMPLLPRLAYALLTLVSMAALLVVLWRASRRFPNGALVFPGLVLWFAWRSLQNYFGFAGVFAMIGDDTGSDEPATDAPA